MNKKGFTLIELLAVIVILGILLGIAIPRVSQYITDSRKKSFIDQALFYVSAVRNDATSEIYPLPIGNNDVTIVTLDKVKSEKSNGKSPFGGKYLYNKSYVAIINVGDGAEPDYKYYFAAQDSKDYAIPLTEESLLEPSIVVAKAKNKMEVTIQSLCGSPEGTTSNYGNLSGLDKVGSSWTATVFSSDLCGKNE